jgi:hypothetical protein
MWPFSWFKKKEQAPPQVVAPTPPAPAETGLERLQREVFERIVEGKPGPAGVDDWRLQIYAGMYQARTHDALIEDVPHTAKLLGGQFPELVRRYVADVPSTHHSLAQLGKGFSKWLREQVTPATPPSNAESIPAGSSSTSAVSVATPPDVTASPVVTVSSGASVAAIAMSANEASVSVDPASAVPSALAVCAAASNVGAGTEAVAEVKVNSSAAPPTAASSPGAASGASTDAAAPPGASAAAPAPSHQHEALPSAHASRADLADLAELEWARSESFVADDFVPVDPEVVQQLGPERFTHAWMQFVPSLRLLELGHDVLSLWKASEEGTELPAPSPQRTYAVVWRKGFEVFHVAITEDEFQAMRAVQARETVAQVCERFAARGDDAAHAAFQAIGSWLNEGMIGALREPPQRDTFRL